jgi:hypothetical protein
LRFLGISGSPRAASYNTVTGAGRRGSCIDEVHGDVYERCARSRRTTYDAALEPAGRPKLTADNRVISKPENDGARVC